MIFQVIYSPAALDDIRGIYSYIAFHLREKRTARNQVDRIRKTVKTLNEMPERYSAVDWEPWASMGMHKVSVNRYVIYYLVEKESQIVTISRIFYGGRDVEAIIQNENDTGKGD